MKPWLLVLSLATLLAASPVFAVDHSNLVEERPLAFEDAEALAFRELAIEVGLVLSSPRGRPAGLRPRLDILYGLALNSDVSISASPSIGGRAGSQRTSFDLEDVSLSGFYNFNREDDNTPAFAVRGDVFLPTGRDASGLGFRARAIMSRGAGQYGRAHLNLDLNVEPSADDDEREFRPGLILGYSRPLGYPRRFNRTGVAELGVQTSARRGTGPVVLAGIGLRQQVTVRSVFDVGIEADIAGFDGAPRDRIRVIVGYSAGY